MATFALCLAVCAMGVSAVAQEKSKEAAEDSSLAGSWKWNRVSASGNVRCQLTLTEKDGKLTGKYSDAEEVKAKVGDVIVKDDEVEIDLEFDIDGKKSVVSLQGKWDGDRITGKIQDGGDAQDWKAVRFLSLDDVAGKWRMSFTTPDGTERNPEFELKSKDGKPDLEFSLGEGDDVPDEGKISKIKFKDGLLVFHMALDFQGQDLSLEYELEFQDRKNLEGSMYFEIGDGAMNGDVDVTGERIK